MRRGRLDVAACRAFLHHYRAGAPLADADRRALPALLRAQRLTKVARRSDDLLAKQHPTTLEEDA